MLLYPIKLFGEYFIKDVDSIPESLLITSPFEEEIISEAESFVFTKFFSLFSLSLKSYLEFFLKPENYFILNFEMDALKFEESERILLNSMSNIYLIAYDPKQKKFLINEKEDLSFLKKSFYEELFNYLDIAIYEIMDKIDDTVFIDAIFSTPAEKTPIKIRLGQISLTLQAEYVF